jgi:hypothetical protein
VYDGDAVVRGHGSPGQQAREFRERLFEEIEMSGIKVIESRPAGSAGMRSSPLSSRIARLAVMASFLVLVAGCGSGGAIGNVGFAGVRSSSYGVDPFPDPAAWEAYTRAMSDAFPDSTPTALWIVGTVDEGISGINLEFPSPGGPYPKISFSAKDLHEEYLDWFDVHGVSVFLQVEPGLADVPTIIGLVLDHYGHHPCVIGFGVDVEWFGNVTEGGEGTPVSDAEASSWEDQIRSYDPDDGLFLKHWDSSFMPPSYRGSIIFVDDSQGHANMRAFLDEMQEWADNFNPNRVFFQYGYESDRPWWIHLREAPTAIGRELAGQTSQECGLFWVDFSLSELD